MTGSHEVRGSSPLSSTTNSTSNGADRTIRPIVVFDAPHRPFFTTMSAVRSGFRIARRDVLHFRCEMFTLPKSTPTDRSDISDLHPDPPNDLLRHERHIDRGRCR